MQFITATVVINETTTVDDIIAKVDERLNTYGAVRLFVNTNKIMQSNLTELYTRLQLSYEYCRHVFGSRQAEFTIGQKKV